MSMQSMKTSPLRSRSQSVSHLKTRSAGSDRKAPTLQERVDLMQLLVEALLTSGNKSPSGGKASQLLGHMAGNEQMSASDTLLERPYFHPHAQSRQREQDRITRENRAIATRLNAIGRERSKYNRDRQLCDYERQVTSLLPPSYANRYCHVVTRVFDIGFEIRESFPLHALDFGCWDRFGRPIAGSPGSVATRS